MAQLKIQPRAGRPQPVRRRRRGPAPVTPESLENAALRYLERYATSTAHLRKLLRNRVEKAQRAYGSESGVGDVPAAINAIESIIERLVTAGMLDDKAYAESLARSQARKGASRRAILARMAAKGLGKAEREQALERLAENSADPELTAAAAYARRRKLGPYRPADERAERRNKDLAALSRRGFATKIARQVIDAPDVEELEHEASL